ncbi:MAG: DUF3365 domain-containing protein [Gammaproteobacteria bacterium]|nr:DUF3365 domain-containing protein [Gammaproteobacteria bacterium]
MKRFTIWLVDYASPLIAFVLILGISSVFWWHYERSNVHMKEVAIDDARNFSKSVAEFRNFYANTIIPSLRMHNIPITHDYLKIPGAVPLPATFAIDFSDKISQNSEYRVRLYSDMPFSWRENGGLHDEFEKKAMAYLRENPNGFVTSYEVLEGKKVLRYAVADVMQASCVACHNSYPGTPKTDWKEGDVRGVLEVIRPISSLHSENDAQAWQTFLAMLGIALLALTLLGVVIRRNRLAVSQAQAEQHKTQSIMDSVVDAIIVTDEQGIVLEANRAVFSVLGYEAEELVGRNINLIIPEPHHSAHDGYLQRYLKEGDPRLIGFTQHLQAVKKSGELIPIDLAVTEMMQDGQRRFTGVVRDVTERESARLQMEQARDQALESAKLKSEFLANMSHEIRTPMNGVIGMTELLLDTPLTEEQKELTQTVKASSESLLSIINDILDFSKIEAGKLEVTEDPVELVPLLDGIMDMVASSAQVKSLDLAYFIEPSLPKVIMTDAVRLRQVLLNLLGNAIKFTQKGHVYLDVAASGDSLRFDVADTGIGISPKGLAKLFSAFSQVDGSSTRGFGGTGLGLAISKQLVSLMGGEISVTSRVGEGSTFSFTLPCRVFDKTPCLQPMAQPTKLVCIMRPSTLVSRCIEQLASLNIQVQVFEDLMLLMESGVELNTPIWLDLDSVLQFVEHPLSLLHDVCVQYHHVSLFVTHKQACEWREHAQRLHFKMRIKPLKYGKLAHWVQPFQLSVQQTEASPSQTISSDQAMVLSDQSRILLVEDNVINQKLALALLKKQGLTATVANNGQEALVILAQQPFDLVLMDCQMPVKDGFDTTLELRANVGINQQVPIIAMTANAMQGDDARCYAVGMNDYIAKPVNPSILAEKLAHWLKVTESHQ